MRQRLRVARHQRVEVIVDPVEKRHVRNRAVFDDLGQARAHFALGQGLQGVEVADHAVRLVKRANHVLANGVVDGGFTAHRRVHLREQGRGHLHKGDATHVASGGKPSHVAHHAAAQSEQHGFAVSALAQQGVKNEVERLPVFVAFAVGQDHGVHVAVAPRQSRGQTLRVERTHRVVGDDESGAGLGQIGPSTGRVEQLAANQNGVAAIAQINGNARDVGGV